jgi:hypothetical protein
MVQFYNQFRNATLDSGNGFGSGYDEESFNTEEQRDQVDYERRTKHDAWVSRHQDATRFEPEQCIVRASLLVAEARRLERTHLEHQVQHAKYLMTEHKRERDDTRRGGLRPANVNTASADKGKATPPPQQEKPVACACTKAPVHRILTSHFRAINLLSKHIDESRVEDVVDQLMHTFNGEEHEMLEDLCRRYGPEPRPSPQLVLRCAQHRLKTLDARWGAIMREVQQEMRENPDCFPNVIRNLSIMRIFLEGSQAATYSCDLTERQRRDALHRSVLEKLGRDKKLFLHQ